MSGEVNRFPLGLLGLLDMKARGAAPRMLSGELQVGIEGIGLYTLAGRELVAASTTAVNAVGSFGSSVTGAATVPAGEVWYVHSYHVAGPGVLAAGTSYRLALGFLQQNVANSQQLASDPSSFTVGELIAIKADWSAIPRWWAPGYAPSVYVSSVTLGTAQTLNFRLLISRFSA